MFRQLSKFLSRSGFLQRASILELAIGLVIIFALQRVVSSLVIDIVMPLIAALTGGINFTNYFAAYSSDVTAVTLAEAQKQGVVFAYGNFLTTVINFIILILISFTLLRLLNKLTVEQASKNS
jgi:large conductance mechanosensitive channel